MYKNGIDFHHELLPPFQSALLTVSYVTLTSHVITIRQQKVFVNKKICNFATNALEYKEIWIRGEMTW